MTLTLSWPYNKTDFLLQLTMQSELYYTRLIHIHIRAHRYIYCSLTQTRANICMYVYMYVCMYVCMSVCVCVCIYIHIRSRLDLSLTFNNRIITAFF